MRKVHQLVRLTINLYNRPEGGPMQNQNHVFEFIHTNLIESAKGTKEVSFPVRVHFYLLDATMIQITHIDATLCGWDVTLDQQGLVFPIVKADALTLHHNEMLELARRAEQPETEK